MIISRRTKPFMTLFVSMMGVLVTVVPLYAATIDVSPTADDFGSDPLVCTLREAIVSINQAADGEGCVATGDAYGTIDTINLAAGTYPLSIVPDASPDDARDGDLDIIKSLIINGSGASNTIIDGGMVDRVFHIGASLSTASVVISNVTIQNGDSGSGDGGGIFVETAGSSLVLNQVTIDNNVAGGVGGGIRSNGFLVIVGSTISGNRAVNDAGGIYVNLQPMTLLNSTISGNMTNERGGGINTVFAIINVTNSTISNNDAGDDGGGIAVTGVGGEANLNNVTVTGNTADIDSDGSGDGGGFRGSPTSTIKDTIIAGNIDTGGEAPDCFLEVISQGYNLIQDTTGCTITADTFTNVTGEDPLLVALANNGGSTQTHALQSGSPAIDAATPAGCTDTLGNPLMQDQRGFPRPIPVGGRCDIGAVEFGRCGDSAVDDGEECDDGNTTSGDGCSATCINQAAPACGDSMLQAGEDCDDGNTVSGDGCSATCSDEGIPACGDGILQSGEACDDGNTTSGDGCSDTCADEVMAPTSGGCSLIRG